MPAKGKFKITLEEVREKAKSRGGICLSKKISIYVKLKCGFGHTWKDSIYHVVKENRWCPICRKIKAQEFKKKILGIIKENGGKLISKYTKYKEKMDILCKFGHIFSITPGNILCGRWCRECRREKLRKYTIEDAKNEAGKRNGKCLTEKYINNYSQQMEWECGENGHRFFATLKSVQQGHWCKECNLPGTQTKNEMIKILNKLFPNFKIETNYCEFKWLKNIGLLQIDFFIPEIKLAIEYDGVQHFKPTFFTSDKEYAKKCFEKQVCRDRLKDKLISEHPNEIQYFIRIPYTEELTLENVKRLLDKPLKNSV